MALSIRRLSHTLGAEIIGLDITKSIDNTTFREIHAAFLEHCLLLFRGQPLTREQFIAFGRHFGELDDNKGLPRIRHPEFAEILVKRRVPSPNPFYSGEVWHSDQSYLSSPAKATLLRGVEMPDVGGDTMFSNQYLAYETLSEGMRCVIANLHGIHFGGKARIDKTTPERATQTSQRHPPIAHPLVMTHPETGRKSLFVGEKVKQIAGMNAEESQLLLQYLCRHASRPQFVYRHRWQTDDVLIWDNRCTNHQAVGDFDRTTQVRHVEKSTVRGTPSGYIYEGPVHYQGPRL